MRHSNWTGARTLLRMRGRLVIFAVAVPLLLILAPGSAAAKRVPSSFVGVVADGPLLKDPNVNYTEQLDTMVAGGVETLRTSFNWSAVQPYKSFDDVPAGQKKRYRDEHGVPTDYSGTDSLVGTAAARHMSVLPVLIAAPRWAARHPGRIS